MLKNYVTLRSEGNQLHAQGPAFLWAKQQMTVMIRISTRKSGSCTTLGYRLLAKTLCLLLPAKAAGMLPPEQ
jgi:hypothetical protein